MIKFNNDNIITGYIKQLLASVNLPQRVGGKWQLIDDNDYYENKSTINKTRQFQIKNNIYDAYTHAYLGDYLRFLRDTKNLDLMPLYNCFSDEIPARLNIHSNKIEFNTDDSNYKIYMVPVKFDQQYTLAIDCADKVELCYGLYGKYQSELTCENNDEVLNTKLAKLTYFTSNKQITFDTPLIIPAIELANLSLDDNTVAKLANLEKDLKLFIKIPSMNKSSIVVLEGNYSSYTKAAPSLNSYEFTRNKFVTNYDENSYDKIAETESIFKPITSLQLLSINTGVSYPFSNSLLGYLLDNNITPLDSIADNIIRLQKVLSAPIDDGTSISTDFSAKNDDAGFWNDTYRRQLYDFASNQPWGYDNLGYVNKQLEEKFSRGSKITNIHESLKTVDIYPELYRDSKQK